MSVLIKDMEMPKTCNTCPCFERDWQDDDIVGYCKAKKTKLQKYKIPFECPLVEVEFNEEQLNIIQNMLSER